jgi:entericidin B
MKTFKKAFLAVSVVLALSTALTACNTIRGAGQDIQSGGHAIAKAAS